MSTGRRDLLEAQRDRIVGVIAAGVEPRDLAALSRELRMVLAELELLEAPVDSDLADELDRKRQERVARSQAAGS